jgi:queuine tRNA-ribosyltransferase
MVLDECAPYPCSPTHAANAVRRTTLWAAQCREIIERSDDGSQLLFPILQGSTDRELRLRSLHELRELDLPGMAIGGLSVGESSGAMMEVLDWVVPEMPADRPRYLMGVGRPQELLEAVARGVDLFDCVLPTRTARNGLAFTSEGRVTIKNSRHRDEDIPLDPRCNCTTCTRFSRAYLRHLYTSGEILSAMLLTHHNLSFYVQLMERIRDAIRTGCFPEFFREVLELFQEPVSRVGPSHSAPVKTSGPEAGPAEGIEDA